MSKLDNPQAATQKWMTAMSGAGTAYTAGINGVQTAPGVLAARASNKYLMGVQANVTKFERNVSAVPLSTWQQLAISKGANRLGSGAAAAEPKFLAFTTSFFAFLKTVEAQVANMPTDTIDQRIAKAVQQMTLTHGYGGYR